MVGHPRRSILRAVDPARESGNKRLAESSFIRPALTAPQLSGTSLEPRTVVAGEDRERVVVDRIVFQCLQHLPYAPVDLRNRVGVQTHSGGTFERGRSRQRNVRKRVCEVKKEWRIARTPDEIDCLLR